MKFTNNSLATVIGWVSTCMLAGGVSTLFNENSRMMWMTWGGFGLAAAVGLDITARVRERMWMADLKLVANKRYERDMKYETDDKEANVAIQQAVARILGRTSPTLHSAVSRRAQARNLCNLEVELHVQQGFTGAAGNDATCTRLARITNLSESGFELVLTERLPRRRMEMIIASANGERQKMFGEVLWDSPQEDGSVLAGGRFLDADSDAGA